MWSSHRPVVGSSDWLDGWRNTCTTLSYEEKKRNRPQEDLNNKKQLSNEKQDSADSDGKQCDSPLGLQAPAEIDAVCYDSDKASDGNEQQRGCARTADGARTPTHSVRTTAQACSTGFTYSSTNIAR